MAWCTTIRTFVPLHAAAAELPKDCHHTGRVSWLQNSYFPYHLTIPPMYVNELIVRDPTSDSITCVTYLTRVTFYE